MTRETHPSAPERSARLFAVWRWFDSAYDRLFSDAGVDRFKQWAILVSIVGFVVHLALIFLAHVMENPPVWVTAAGHNYLSAISTPFNFILFFEVLTLIATLAASTTRSIAGQFEVVSLIFIRDVFQDIAAAGRLTVEGSLTPQTLALFEHMWAGLLMFLLVALFRHVSARKPHTSGTLEYSAGLQRFISQKKAVSIGLTAMLIVMGAYSLWVHVLAVWTGIRNGAPIVEPAATFYNDLFTVMIFTDVLILILSLAASAQYEMVFRNAAFVVAIILIRFALTETYPFGAILAVMSMAFSVLVVLIYNYHARLSGGPGI